jgi:hypothetical protein
MSKSVLDVVIRDAVGGMLTANEMRQIMFDEFEPPPIAAAQGAELKHDCGFCHGRTVDDVRGNCGACGAPR